MWYRNTASACRNTPVLTIWGEHDGAVRAIPEPTLLSKAVNCKLSWLGAGNAAGVGAGRQVAALLAAGDAGGRPIRRRAIQLAGAGEECLEHELRRGRLAARSTTPRGWECPAARSV